ncbi:MAG: type VI secretion system transmembrane protein TssO [Bacteroides sp.]|nr:type VI secretion system transmembrane protein TssO [Bacteroides sp.]
MKNSTTKNYINRNERIGGMIYVFLLFALGTGLLAWLFVAGNNLNHIFSRKDSVQIKMERQQSFRRVQEQNVAVSDLLTARIAAYDPGVNAVYEKNDIQYIINEIRKLYEDNRHDKRYIMFLHISDFYQMWFSDRQYLWSLTANLEYLKRNLEDCELGLNRKKEERKNNK